MNNKFFLETIKSLDGKIYNLLYHQQRFNKVLHSLGLKVFPNLEIFLNPPQKGLFRCRVVYSINTLEVTYHEYTPRNIQTIKLIEDNTIFYSKKMLNRKSLDAVFQKRGKCDDVLIVQNNLLTDTTIANVALYKKGKWYTPKKPLLEGTTRKRYLESKEIIQKDIFVDDINSYEKIALLNAMIDFDEKPIKILIV